MEKEKHPVQVRCMAFPSPDKEGSWCAVALEMDIWGFGNTAEEAMSDLDELIEIQIEFAAGKKKLSILDHPADKKWFQLWDTLHKIEELLRNNPSLRDALQKSKRLKSDSSVWDVLQRFEELKNSPCFSEQTRNASEETRCYIRAA